MARRIAGIDVSEYQGAIDWKRVRAAGIEFAYMRATDGRGYTDKRFSTNRDGCMGEGVLCGAYHLFRPNVSIGEQAEHFLYVVGPDFGDLVPCLDVEIAPHAGVDLAAVVLEWCREVEQRTNRKPILYVAPWLAHQQRLENMPALAAYDLWVAEWVSGSTAPTVPKPWTGWRMWQHWNKGRIDGIAGDVDLDWMICDDDAAPEVVTPSPYPMPRPVPQVIS